MSKIIKCPSCGKETPESGIVFKDTDVKKALSASLDCNGTPIYDFSLMTGVKNANYCYWCGANIDEIEAELAAEAKAKAKAERKAIAEKARRAREKRHKAILAAMIVVSVVLIVLVMCYSLTLGIIILAIILYYRKQIISFYKTTWEWLKSIESKIIK